MGERGKYLHRGRNKGQMAKRRAYWLCTGILPGEQPVSGSKYLYSGYEEKEYVKHWKENGWVKADGHEVKNRDKWQELDWLLQGNLVRFLLHENNAYTRV